MRYQRADFPLKLEGREAARNFFAGCFADTDPTCESLWVAHVDEQARCVHLSRHEGDEKGADFPIRSIIADAAAHGSAGIVLAHNHPSGDSTPSDADCRATRRLASAAEALDCDPRSSGVRRHEVHQPARPWPSLDRLGCSNPCTA